MCACEGSGRNLRGGSTGEEHFVWREHCEQKEQRWRKLSLSLCRVLIGEGAGACGRGARCAGGVGNGAEREKM